MAERQLAGQRPHLRWVHEHKVLTGVLGVAAAMAIGAAATGVNLKEYPVNVVSADSGLRANPNGVIEAKIAPVTRNQITIKGVLFESRTKDDMLHRMSLGHAGKIQEIVDTSPTNIELLGCTSTMVSEDGQTGHLRVSNVILDKQTEHVVEYEAANGDVFTCKGFKIDHPEGLWHQYADPQHTWAEAPLVEQ